MTKKDYTLLIYNYLNGIISEKDQLDLHQWLSVPGNQKQFEEIKNIWELTKESTHANPHKVISGKIELETRIREIARQESRITRLKRQSSWLAGTFAMIIVLVLILLSPYYILDEKRLIMTNLYSESQTQTILPDSSMVSLNDSTRITYEESHKLRKLTLSGEAFFNIKEDQHKPLVVHAGLVQVKVTGTSFAVQAYPGQYVKVILESGEVTVSLGDKSVILRNSGEMAVIDTAFYKKENTNPNLLSWYSRTYHFDKTALREIIHLLEKDFRVSIAVEDKGLLNCRFSGRFKQNESLGTIMNVICLSLNLTTKSNGLNYTITGTGCPENEFQ